MNRNILGPICNCPHTKRKLVTRNDCFAKNSIDVEGVCINYDGKKCFACQYSGDINGCQAFGKQWLPSYEDNHCINTKTGEKKEYHQNGAIYDITTVGNNLKDTRCKCNDMGVACNCRNSVTAPFSGINNIFGCFYKK